MYLLCVYYPPIKLIKATNVLWISIHTFDNPYENEKKNSPSFYVFKSRSHMVKCFMRMITFQTHTHSH